MRSAAAASLPPAPSGASPTSRRSRAARRAGDLEHVVLVGLHRPGPHRLGPLGQAGHVVPQGRAGRHHHRLGPAAGHGRHREGQVLCRADVGHLAVQADEFGHVLEPGEAGLHAVAAAVGRQLERGDGAAERRRPRVEGGQVGAVQHVGLQERLHGPQLGDGVGHRRGGGERRHPRAAGAPQRPQLGVEVLGPPRARHAHTLDRGVHPAVFERVRLVAEHVVHARLLEAHAVVLGLGGEQAPVGLLELGQAPLEALDADALARPGLGHRGAQAPQVLVEVGGVEVAPEGDTAEPGVGEDHAVPVAGGAAGHELLAALLGQPLPVGDEQLGCRVELEPLTRELLEHVVGHHHGRLGRHSQPAQLHGRHHHRRRLAGAHHVRQQHPAVGEDAGHGIALVGMGREGGGQAGEAQVGPVVTGDDHGAEQLVVAPGQALRAPRVLPHPR